MWLVCLSLGVPVWAVASSWICGSKTQERNQAAVRDWEPYMGLRVERKENRVQPSPEDPSPGGLSKTRTVENKQL